MSAQNKANKEKILEAAVQLLKQGNELSARNLAKQLKCSTQPIYSAFKNMEELELVVLEKVQGIYNKKMEEYQKTIKQPFHKFFGIGFVKFARDERELFSFLYLKNFSSVPEIFSESFLNKVTDEISRNYGIAKEIAYKFYLDILVYAYGLAVMQYLGEVASDKVIENRISFEFDALCKMYGLK